MKTKSVCYSYPTSPNAERFKLRNGGYCVSTITHTQISEPWPPQAIAMFPTLDEAKAYADKLELPYDRLSL